MISSTDDRFFTYEFQPARRTRTTGDRARHAARRASRRSQPTGRTCRTPRRLSLTRSARVDRFAIVLTPPLALSPSGIRLLSSTCRPSSSLRRRHRLELRCRRRGENGGPRAGAVCLGRPLISVVAPPAATGRDVDRAGPTCWVSVHASAGFVVGARVAHEVAACPRSDEHVEILVDSVDCEHRWDRRRASEGSLDVPTVDRRLVRLAPHPPTNSVR